MDWRRKVLQLIPAHPGTIAYVIIDEHEYALPVVCWAITEWHDEDGVSRDINAVVLKDQQRPTVLEDMLEVNRVDRIELPEST